MTCCNLVRAKLRVSAIMGAVVALSFPLSAQTSGEDPQATIAALRAALAARDAEIATLKETAPKAAAPVASTKAADPAAAAAQRLAAEVSAPAAKGSMTQEGTKEDPILMGSLNIRTHS